MRVSPAVFAGVCRRDHWSGRRPAERCDGAGETVYSDKTYLCLRFHHRSTGVCVRRRRSGTFGSYDDWSSGCCDRAVSGYALQVESAAD